MKKISQLFLQGLLAIFPITVTIAVLYWLGSTAEATLGRLLNYLLPDHWYLPGMGIISGFLFLIMIGLLLNAYLFRQLGLFTEKLFSSIPLVRTIYRSVRDIAKFASASQTKEELKTAVLVTLDEDIRLIGFITSRADQFSDKGPLYAVYLPLSYQIGGYTVLLPESRIQHLEMNVQDAMRYVLTAAMAQPNPKDNETR